MSKGGHWRTEGVAYSEKWTTNICLHLYYSMNALKNIKKKSIFLYQNGFNSCHTFPYISVIDIIVIISIIIY